MPADMATILDGLREMRMQQAAALVIMRRLGVERVDVSRQEATESAAFDLRFVATAEGFAVELVAAPKARGGLGR